MERNESPWGRLSSASPAVLQRLLRAALPSERLNVGAEVTSVDQSVPSRVRIPVGNGVLEADLVVAADRVGSRLHSDCYPITPAPSTADRRSCVASPST
jgi:2-polyprenyl-6-methoxyphenol hydroxylase-like FAD-dependent oxidoreductase